MSTTTITQPKSLNFWQIWLKTTLFTGLFLIIFFLITTAVLAVIGYRFINQTLKTAEMSYSEITDTLISTQQLIDQTQSSIKFLILGSDKLAERSDQTVMTDTILALNFNLKSGRLDSLSIPRDLWHPAYQTKVNALLSYGHEFYPDEPEKFVSQALNELTGIESDYTVIISLDLLAQLIEIVDGVEVNVERGFIDEEFPRPGVDPNSKDPELLYKTVIFEPGVQTLRSDRALEYIRSRKSVDPETGTDIARSIRQQQVLEALIKKLTDKSTFKSPQTIGQLLKLYRAEIDQYLPLNRALAIGFKFAEAGSNLEFIQHSIPVYPENENGLIFHPHLNLYQNQWVFAEKTTGLLKVEVPKLLNYSNL